MKQTVLLLTLALFCVLIPGNFAHAQFGGQPDSDGDCDKEEEIIPPNYSDYSLDIEDEHSFGGCSYTLIYDAYKYNTVPIPYYEIKNVQLIIDRNDPDCQGKTMEEIYKYAVSRAMSEVGWEFDVQSPAIYYVDVNTPSCWNITTVNNEDTYEQCGDRCCKTRYLIEVQNGAPFVTWTTLQSEALVCSSINPTLSCALSVDCTLGEVPLYSELPYGPHWSCTMPCPNESFWNQPPVEYELNKNPVGESCKVSYAKRTCETLELTVDRISTYYGLNGPDITYEQMLQETIENLLGDVIEINGTFTNEVVVRIPSCWNEKTVTKIVDDDIYVKNILEPCDINLCCSATYTLANNNNVISVVGYPIVDDQTENCIPNTCANLCDVLSDITGPMPLRPTGVRNNINSMDNILFAPNPTLGSTSVNFSSAETGKIIAGIYDLNGYLIQEIFDTKLNEKFMFNFNAADFSSGTYYMKIMIADKLVATGKFIVK